MKSTPIVSKNTTIGKNSQIDDFAILGYGGPAMLKIGTKAHIRSHSVIYYGSLIGNNFQTGVGVSIRENCRIGDNVSVGTHSVIEHDVIIEDNVRLHSNVFVPELTLIKKNAWIGPNVVFTNAHVPLCPNAPDCFQGVIVEEGAKIGANVTILPGVTIGKNSLIGAGAVVTKNISANQVAIGNPARAVKSVSQLICPVEDKRKH